MAPFGDYKGASLALIVDILAAGMTGSSFTFEASTTTARHDPPNLGQFIMAMHPAAFGVPGFGTHLETLFAAMLTQ
jgi:(2R)-3-sulfolactate dehydrogenase (NADP+)